MPTKAQLEKDRENIFAELASYKIKASRLDSERMSLTAHIERLQKENIWAKNIITELLQIFRNKNIRDS